MRIALFAIALMVLMTMTTLAGPTVPVLHYTPPPNTYKSAMAPPDDYSFNGFNASVQVYPFQKFQGDIGQAFQQSLLREWISPMHQEENVATQPQFQQFNIPGAQVTIIATFIENRVGIARPHNRTLIVSGNYAAIIDASAATPESWQQAIAPLNAMASSLRVDSAPAPPDVTAGPGAIGKQIAGLYMGMKQKYMTSMTNIVGHGYYQNALHYYLFSAEGRVYRAYDQLAVPDGNPSAFDFDSAEQRDAMNSGRYTIQNGQLYIQMEGPQPEVITTALPSNGSLTIQGVQYKRQ